MVLPLYFVLPNLELFVVKNYNRDITWLSATEVVLPVSLIAAMLITFIFLLRSPKHIFRMLTQYGLLVLLLLDVGLITALFFGLVLVFILNARFFFDSFSIGDSAKIFYGSVIALGLVSLGAFYDFLVAHAGNFDLLYGVNSSFGYEIYAFYVSYSAVVTLFLMLLLSDLMLKKVVPAPLSFVCIFLLLVSLFGASRKAVFLELFLYFCFLIPITFNILRLTLSLKKLLLSSLVFLGVVAYFVWMQNYRPFSAKTMIDSRGESNSIFLDIVEKIDAWQFLFGFESGFFGGYSNLLLDLFARLGAVGVLTVGFLIAYASINLAKHWGIQKSQIAILIPLLVNLAVGNSANLNLTQPYYVTALISACFLLNTYRRVR